MARYAYPVQSEFRAPKTANNPNALKNLFIKQYPNFFKREDVRRDFVATQQELHVALPYAHVIKEDIDCTFARLQYDVAPAEEVLLERMLLKRGFIKAE